MAFNPIHAIAVSNGLTGNRDDAEAKAVASPT